MKEQKLMCRFTVKEGRKIQEFREVLGLEPITLVINRGSLAWFGPVEHEYYNDDGD